MALSYRPAFCAVCDEPIKLGRKYVHPARYPYSLAGFGEDDIAHHECALRARTRVTLESASDLSDLLSED